MRKLIEILFYAFIPIQNVFAARGYSSYERGASEGWIVFALLLLLVALMYVKEEFKISRGRGTKSLLVVGGLGALVVIFPIVGAILVGIVAVIVMILIFKESFL